MYISEELDMRHVRVGNDLPPAPLQVLARHIAGPDVMNGRHTDLMDKFREMQMIRQPRVEVDGIANIPDFIEVREIIIFMTLPDSHVDFAEDLDLSNRKYVELDKAVDCLVTKTSATPKQLRDCADFQELEEAIRLVWDLFEGESEDDLMNLRCSPHYPRLERAKRTFMDVSSQGNPFRQPQFIEIDVAINLLVNLTRPADQKLPIAEKLEGQQLKDVLKKLTEKYQH